MHDWWWLLKFWTEIRLVRDLQQVFKGDGFQAFWVSGVLDRVADEANLDCWLCTSPPWVFPPGNRCIFFKEVLQKFSHFLELNLPFMKWLLWHSWPDNCRMLSEKRVQGGEKLTVLFMFPVKASRVLKILLPGNYKVIAALRAWLTIFCLLEDIEKPLEDILTHWNQWFFYVNSGHRQPVLRIWWLGILLWRSFVTWS